MGVLQVFLGKPKARREEAMRLSHQAAMELEKKLNENEIKAVHNAIEEFYTTSAMWSYCQMSSEGLIVCLVVFAKHMSRFFRDKHHERFTQDELVRLSQSAVLTELGVLLNNQRTSPNSELAVLLADTIIYQKLARDSSLLLLIESPEVLKEEKDRIQDMISCLGDGKVKQAMNIMEYNGKIGGLMNDRARRTTKLKQHNLPLRISQVS